MKKVLFMSLAMAVAMTGFAQRVVVSNDAKNASATAKKPAAARQIDGSAVEGIQFNMAKNMVSNRSLDDFDEYTAMTTNYDLQSNSALGNRIATWPDGSASFVATWDHSMQTSFPDRGAGYNFYTPDMKGMGDEPEVRQEPMKSGWPTIAACGEGEVLASHATGVNLYYRPTKGEGEWELIYNWGNDYGSPTWPRVVVSGPNNEFIHLVMCKQISLPDGSLDNHVYYVRVKHVGDTWEIPTELNDFPGVDNELEGEYRNQLSADDYVMAANGNNVVCMFGSYTTEVFYMISHDNGETWERQIIAPYPILGDNGEPVHAIDFADYPEGMTDSIITSDNSHSITIDNNGTVHATFGLFRWKVADAESYTYWPAYSYGIVYWNSNYTNEQGGHEIPVFGAWSQDSEQFPAWYADCGLSYTLFIDRLDALAEADGRQNLNVFGYVDENGNGQMDYENVTGASWHYRSLGLATMPSISVDNLGDLCIIYSVWSETRVNATTGFSYRSAYVAYKDFAGEWVVDENGINLAEDFVHELEEQYPCVAANHGYNGTFWVMYSGDENQGLYLDISDTYPNSNGGVLTENYQYACLIRPETLSVNEQEAVNPMTTTRVYPNPATDVLNIEVNASQASEMSINVYNIMGQNVMSKNVNITTGMNTRSISTSELNSGIYFVTVKANGFENTMKFVVK
jgi:hypothetical protein